MDVGIAVKGLIVDPMLLEEAIDYNGIPRSKWMIQIVLLHDPT